MKLLKAAVLAAVAAAGLAEIAQPHALIAAAPPPDDQAILHVLNRLGFGPRPGDVERVRAIGLSAYIDQQLHPDRVADREMTARLSTLKTLAMSSRALADEYERPAIEARRAQR